MQEEILFIFVLFFFFIMTGVFGGIGIYSLLKNQKKRAKWSFGIGFICILLYVAAMFSLM